MFWFFLLTCALALRPVKEFRVKDIGSFSTSTKSTGIKAAAVENKAVTSVTSTISITTTTSISLLAPTITLGSDIHIVDTDSSNSIYFLNSTIFDQDDDYNQTFSLLLDTGSANSWIYNESCDTSTCENVARFNDFSHSIISKSTFDLAYSGDSIKGDIINTSSNGLNFSIDDLTLSNFSFGLAQSSPDMFEDYDVSGIIGIPSTAGSSSLNLIHQLYDQGLIDKQVFALSLVASDQTIQYLNSDNKESTLPSGYGGLLVLGSKATEDSSDFISDSNIYYTDIVENLNSYWLVNISSVILTNDSSSEDMDVSPQAIIDTGTTGLALPMDDANSLHSQLFGLSLVQDNDGNYAFLCNASNTEISFVINGHKFNLTSDDFKASEYSGNGLDGYCASKIQGIDNDNYWILGASFLSKFYTVFDMDKNRIGFGDNRITTYTIKESGTYDMSNTTSVAITSTTSSSSSSSKSSKKSLSTSASTSSSASKSANSTSSSTRDSGASVTSSYHMAILILLLSFVI